MSERPRRVFLQALHTPFKARAHVFGFFFFFRLEKGEKKKTSFLEFLNSLFLPRYCAILLLVCPNKSTGSFVSFPTLIHAACAPAPQMERWKTTKGMKKNKKNKNPNKNNRKHPKRSLGAKRRQNKRRGCSYRVH